MTHTHPQAFILKHFIPTPRVGKASLLCPPSECSQLWGETLQLLNRTGCKELGAGSGESCAQLKQRARSGKAAIPQTSMGQLLFQTMCVAYHEHWLDADMRRRVTSDELAVPCCTQEILSHQHCQCPLPCKGCEGAGYSDNYLGR